MGNYFWKPDPKDNSITALTTKSMELSDKIAVMKQNALHTTGGVSGGGLASCEGSVMGTRYLPLWCIEKNSESV